MMSQRNTLRIIALAIFGISYSSILGGCVLLAIFVFDLANWDASHQKAVQNIGFVVNMAALVLAITLALSQRVHELLKRSFGLFGFYSLMAELRLSLTVGIALLAILIDVSAYAVTARLATGEAAIPPLIRLATLVAVYSVIAWMAISHAVTRRFRDVRR